MKFVPTALTRSVGRQVLLSQKNSPTILFGVGVIGVIGSTVLACRATLKLNELVHETQGDLDAAKTMDHPNYSDRDRQKDVALIYTRSVVKLGRLYGPSILLGAASIGCLTKSHNMLNQRNVALTAAYAAVEKAFGEYRGRVIEKYGEDEDREFRYSAEEVEVVDERGRTSKVIRVGDAEPSMYARYFDELSPNWSKDPEYNLVFLRCQQNWANEMLRARGHLFLNEVYDALGISRTGAGAVVGWVLSPDRRGDNYIDFGLYDNNDKVRDFINGREGSILLDFNVDGTIYDKIGNEPKEKIRWQS